MDARDHRAQARGQYSGAAAAADWMTGYEVGSVEYTTALRGEAAMTELLAAMAPALQALTAAQLVDGLGDLLSAADKAALNGELADYLLATFRTGLGPGIDGWRDDDPAFVRDWGLSLSDGAPVAVWQGDQDVMVPFAHGAWLAEHVPTARAHFVPGASHLTLPLDDVVADVLELAGRSD